MRVNFEKEFTQVEYFERVLGESRFVNKLELPLVL